MRDLDALMALPPTPYDACEKICTRATSISMVRYRNNDYSVPTAFAHHEVQIRGYVHEVVIGCGAEVIARHARSYEKADMVFDPMHYLPLLEQKVGALDQAAPLQGWDLPDAFATLRRLLEARMGKLLASQDLLIIDELGFVPLSKTGAELLFEVISQRYERGSIIITSNLPFDEWTEVFGSERLTGAILDRLTHHVHILEMNGDSFRLRQSRKAQG